MAFATCGDRLPGTIPGLHEMVRIAAVVPVRAGSKGVPQKSSRQFSDTSLLEAKLFVLDEVRDLFSEVIVSSDCDICLQLAAEFGFTPIRRSPEYSSDDCIPSDLWLHLASLTNADAILVTSVSCPFLEANILRQVVETFKEKCCLDGAFNSVATAELLEEHLWWAGHPLNYSLNNACSRRDLQQSAWKITYGAVISPRSTVLENKNILGNNPFFFPVSKLEGLEVSESWEFLVAEALFQRGIRTTSDVYLPHLKANLKGYLQADVESPVLLDCTIRDGGYRTNWLFPHSQVAAAYQAANAAGFQVFEAGFMQAKNSAGTNGEWCHVTPSLIDGVLAPIKQATTMIASMVRAEWCTEHVPDSSAWCMDIIRVLFKFPLNDDYLRKGIKTCQKLSLKGYTIHMNFARGGELRHRDFLRIATMLREKAFFPAVITLADTFGDLLDTHVSKIIASLSASLRGPQLEDIAIGFHAHNGLENANAKAIAAWKAGATFIDSCVNGFGRGPGNAHSEFLARYWKTGVTGQIDRLAETAFRMSLTIEERHIYAHAASQGIHPEYANFAVSSLHDSNFDPSAFLEAVLRANIHQSFIPAMAENVKETHSMK